WDERRHALHEQLARQNEEVLSQVKTLEAKTSATAAAAQIAKSQGGALDQRLRLEESQLARREDELTARRTQASQAAKESQTSRTELTHLTAELRRMERTLAD